mgnify:FL=1
MPKLKVLILGAAGRDFHNFNVVFRNNPDYEVVGFTATQIPDIDGRLYPPELAGELYPEGIPIFDERVLKGKIHELGVDLCVFSYSDVPHSYVMNLAETVNANGATFAMLGAQQTMIKSNKPVVAVCAVRTGCGKSQTSRYIIELLEDMGHKVVAIRHPMPYGDLAAQAVQRFGKPDDLITHKCTIEEIEEYEPHIARDGVIYAGVDYAAILAEAEQECDIVLWDGGNNDTSFYHPDVLVVVVDPLRAGHELTYYPGLQNLQLADIVVINKVDTASDLAVQQLRATIERENPLAKIIECESPPEVDYPDVIRGQRVLVIEDGPTCTHGEMNIGAGTVAARQHECQIVDPRPYLQGKLQATFTKYPNIGQLLPAMGYGDEQVADLQATVQAMADAGVIDAIIVGTPINLGRIIELPLPSVRVTYNLEPLDDTLPGLLKAKLGAVKS